MSFTPTDDVHRDFGSGAGQTALAAGGVESGGLRQPLDCMTNSTRVIIMQVDEPIMETGEADDVAASEEPSGSPGRFEINSVRSRRQSTVKFVEGDNVSRESSGIFCQNYILSQPHTNIIQFTILNALIFLF